jgi:ribosome-associated protein
MRVVAVSDGMIRLGQFLKLANMVDTGSEAKRSIAAGSVRVHDDVELRRGRQLDSGDVVAVGNERARVA